MQMFHVWVTLYTDFKGFTTTSLEQTILVRRTQAVALPCNHVTSSTPPPRIGWLRDGQPIDITYDRYLLLPDSKLAIYSLRSSDITNGNRTIEYQCMVTNANVTERVVSPTKIILSTGTIRTCTHKLQCWQSRVMLLLE